MNEILNDEQEIIDQLTQDLPKDIKDIKKFLRIEQEYEATYVIALAIHNEDEYNRYIDISCEMGQPLHPSIYNVVRDCYEVRAFEVFDIGFIGVSYKAYVDESEWRTSIPLPLAVIKRHMSESQKREYELWRSQYKSNYTIQLVQLSAVY